MDQPLALAQWALRLPEDPRTLEIFRQSVEGAAYSDFEAVQATLQATRRLAAGKRTGRPFKVKQQREAEAEEEEE